MPVPLRDSYVGRTVLVCGGRFFTNRMLLFRVLSAEHAARPIGLIVHGAAQGADGMSGSWAKAHGVKVSAYPAQWNVYRERAGPIRNQFMLDYAKPDLVIAFPGGDGTSDMVRRTRAARVPLMVVACDENAQEIKPGWATTG